MRRELVAILRGIDTLTALPTVHAILDAGITRVEVPLNSPRPFDTIQLLASEFGDQALIGAGTVLDVLEVQRVFSAGGKLIVSPHCDEAIIRETVRLGMQSLPGALTPQECILAIRSGADGLKIFPASVSGFSGIAALRAVLPAETRLYAVGGAGPANFEQWLAAGASGFGIGTALYRPGATPIETGHRASQIVAAYDRAVTAR